MKEIEEEEEGKRKKKKKKEKLVHFTSWFISLTECCAKNVLCYSYHEFINVACTFFIVQKYTYSREIVFSRLTNKKTVKSSG